jgi:FkbM family methyltransferase
MPLRARELATDWDNLLSLLGAELEVKRLYRGLLAGPPGERPEVFLDCGASYGTHSLLWGSHGVRVVAFEPNPECHATFEWITRQLAMPPTLHPLALGARSGRNTLWYPADETWIGRVAAESDRPARTTTGSASAWRSAAVDVVTLDAMRCAIPAGRLLVKIDVEGAELDVLRGAARLLAERRPLIVVESTPGRARAELCQFLGDLGYAVTPLVPPRAKSAAAINLLARPIDANV